MVAVTEPNNHTATPPPPQQGTLPPAAASPATRPPHRLPRSRAGGLWVALVTFAVVLLLLLIFILQNGQRSDVYFLGAHGHLPMGVALLLSAIFGVLLIALPTVVRILQLRLMASGRRGRIAAAAQSPTSQLAPTDEQAPSTEQKPAGS